MIQDHCEVVDYGHSDEALLNSCKALQKMVALGNAFVSRSFIHESSFQKLLRSGMYATYYLFSVNRRIE